MSTATFHMLRPVDADYIERVRECAERFRDGVNHERLPLYQAVRAMRKCWSPPYTHSSIDEITYAAYGARRKK